MSNVVRLSDFRRPAVVVAFPRPLRIDVYQDGNDEPTVTDWLMEHALGHLSVADYETVAQALEAGKDVRFGPMVVRASSMDGRA
jgi:hypothetical protein